LCSLYSFTPMSWLVFVSISICVIFSIALFIDRTIYLEMRLSIVIEIMFGYIILSTMFFLPYVLLLFNLVFEMFSFWEIFGCLWFQRINARLQNTTNNRKDSLKDIMTWILWLKQDFSREVLLRYIILSPYRFKLQLRSRLHWEH
jgi:hypothetical protein